MCVDQENVAYTLTQQHYFVNFFTIIYFTSLTSCLQNQKSTRPENHVLKSGLSSFLLSTSYKCTCNVHVMSNLIKDRKIHFCGGNTICYRVKAPADVKRSWIST